ncbi:methyltransferase [Rhodospirillales bacterium]|nr:methyltransferase [Rhodospirillales bacterium]
MRKVETKTEGRSSRPVKELLSIAQVSLEEEDYGSSVFQFLNILKRDPNSAVARFGLGDAYFGLADYESAESTYRFGLEMYPNNSDGLFGLAATLRIIESYDEAIEFYERGFDVEPSRTAAYWELAYTREMTGDKIGAEWAYRKCLEKDPNHGMAKHLLASMLGTTTDRAPDDYVRDLFDDYADSFEQDLLNDLNYVVPTLIRKELKKITRSPNFQKICRFSSALDLGCGTGLVSEAIKGLVTKTDGVDLSEKMVKVAFEHQRYDNIYLQEMTTFLLDRTVGKPKYDLIVSGDALVYLGDLRSVFNGVSKRLSGKGVFCFSVEKLRSGSFSLCPTGRYAHSDGYIRDLSRTFGFELLAARDIVPRMDGSLKIRGRLYLLSLNGKS